MVDPTEKPAPSVMQTMKTLSLVMAHAMQLKAVSGEADAFKYLQHAMQEPEVVEASQLFHSRDVMPPPSLEAMAVAGGWHDSCLSHAMSIESHVEHNEAYEVNSFGGCDEFVLKTHSGRDLRFDPLTLDYLRVTDRGVELMHWTFDEILEDRTALIAALMMAGGSTSYPVHSDLAEHIDQTRAEPTYGDR